MTKDEIVLEQEKIKLNLLKEELKQKVNLKEKKEIVNSVTATLLVALIGFLGTTIVSLINSVREKDLKQREFEYEIIKNALGEPTEDKRLGLLKFINKMKLIKDDEVSSSLNILLEDPKNIPSISLHNITFPEDPIIVDEEFQKKDRNLSLLALDAAKKYIGVSEVDTKTIAKFNRGGSNPYWSCSFICWCFSQNSNGQPPFKFTYSWRYLTKRIFSSKNVQNKF